MAKKSKRTLDKADTQRYVICSFCGRQHRRRSKELAECRDRHRKGLGGKEPASGSPSGERHAGDETTRYRTDPLGGDKRAHTILRMRKAGYPARKIAKELGVNLTVVEDVIGRI